MMKFVVLAMAMSAACANVIPATYSGANVIPATYAGAYSGPGLHGAYSGLPVAGAYSGLPVAGAYSGLGLHGAYSGVPVAGAYSGLGLHGAYSGLPVAGAYSALPVPTLTHTGYSVAAGAPVHPQVPVTYAAAPVPAIVAPQPYSVHTGTKVAVAAEPVEQHGYVIKY